MGEDVCVLYYAQMKSKLVCVCYKMSFISVTFSRTFFESKKCSTKNEFPLRMHKMFFKHFRTSNPQFRKNFLKQSRYDKICRTHQQLLPFPKFNSRNFAMFPQNFHHFQNQFLQFIRVYSFPFACCYYYYYLSTGTLNCFISY